jgi:predicted enzyme related to lactoylglutathione lyase
VAVLAREPRQVLDKRSPIERVGRSLILTGILCAAQMPAGRGRPPAVDAMSIEVTLDCNDLDGLARFWQAAFECEWQETVPNEYISLTSPGGFTLTLQTVPEPKAGKNRMHLDLLVSDLEQEVARLKSLGATSVSDRIELYGARWYVMADPEGNEFCVAAKP